jgi:ABC-type siderophore export system fused ATPase/permease subunit
MKYNSTFTMNEIIGLLISIVLTLGVYGFVLYLSIYLFGLWLGIVLFFTSLSLFIIAAEKFFEGLGS